MTAHRWMAFVPFEVTAEDARRLTTGEGVPAHLVHAPDSQLAAGEAPDPADPRPFLGLHNVVRELVSVGCYVCEQPWSPEVADEPCPGDPEGRDLELPEPKIELAPVGRNDPCPCGSGRKFKRCHGA